MSHQHCSWNEMKPATMSFCEGLVCDSWLIQPSNAISSLSFVIIGICLLNIMRKEKETGIFYLFPVSAILVGITSFLYHASWTFFFQVFDVSSMFMLSCLLLSFNLWRLGHLHFKSLILFYVVSVVSSSAFMVIVQGQSGEILFSIQVILLLGLELFMFLKKHKIDYHYFYYSIATFLVAFIIWTLDAKEILCWKNNHFFQGHSLWHLLNAICFYFLYRFYKQFRPSIES